jgi:hypothetical protein
MHSFQETQARDFKLKQESDLQAFMKKQKAEQSSFHSNQTNDWNNLKERHTQVSYVVLITALHFTALHCTVLN